MHLVPNMTEGLSSIQPEILVTPTPRSPANPTTTLDVGPPSGWVAAGLLALLLAVMLYQSLKSLMRKIFRGKRGKR